MRVSLKVLKGQVALVFFVSFVLLTELRAIRDMTPW